MRITLRRGSCGPGSRIAPGASSCPASMAGVLTLLCLAMALLTGAGRGDTARAAGLPAEGRRDGVLCQTAITLVERRSSLPQRLLSAISLVESGRPIPGGRVAAWPWTINVGGTGTFYETADAAVGAVEALQAAGVRSIDVGCMQVNLMHHPDAFASLRDAFDPVLNVAYAARFLGRLHAETGEWPKAVAAYHSRTPDLAADYTRKVARVWPDNAAYGLSPPEAGRLMGANDAYGLQTPEFAARLRQAADDHAKLTRTIVGPGWSGSQVLRQRLQLRLPELLRVAQAGRVPDRGSEGR